MNPEKQNSEVLSRKFTRTKRCGVLASGEDYSALSPLLIRLQTSRDLFLLLSPGVAGTLSLSLGSPGLEKVADRVLFPQLTRSSTHSPQARLVLLDQPSHVSVL